MVKIAYTKYCILLRTFVVLNTLKIFTLDNFNGWNYTLDNFGSLNNLYDQLDHLYQMYTQN
jgi:hypothetical protein